MDPYRIVKSRYVTEKSIVLENLHTATSNRSLSACKNPKFVFLVDPSANKQQIATAVEMIYAERNVKVVAVNTIFVKAKPKRRGRGRPGARASFKKAIVTLEAGDSLDAG
ncbi:MAG: 50S ribosomal protein L23 [Parachlamydiales bacterium]|nr:50S ribosomal protein L23 [Parachlamydiales bacterium]